MPSSDPILAFHRMTKTYPGAPAPALHEVSGEVRPGEFIAVIGPSGAGKSTLLRCLNRLVEPTAGSIHLRGRNLTHAHGRGLRALRQEVGMIFQQFNLVGRLTVLQNVLAGRLRFARSPARHAASMVRWFPRAERDIALAHLGRVGIAHQAHKRADELSGGQQQRVAIARVLAQDAGVVLADEPIASLDPRSAEVVMTTLRDINRERGIPVVVNLHQVDIARRYSTRVIGMHGGEIVFDGPPDTLDDRALRAIYDGSEHEIEAARPSDNARAAPEEVPA